MATYLFPVAATAAAARKYTPPLKGNQKCVLSQVITMATTDLDLNDTVDVGWLPKGAIVTDCVIYATDMDTGATLVLDVGPTTNPDAYIDGAALSTPAAAVRAGNVLGSQATMATEAGTPLTADVKVIVTVATAAGTAASGTLAVHIEYFVPA